MSKGPTPSLFVVENLTRGTLVASRVRAARDSAERRRGLLNVSEIDSNAGLWINPCEAVHTFGMQVAIDVVFLDAKWRVKKVKCQLKPNRLAACLVARSVLEIKAGGTKVSGTELGDQLSIRLAGESARDATVATDIRR